MAWRSLKCVPLVMLLLGTFATPSFAWKNGPANNKVTNSKIDCVTPPYSTHDWIADHGLALLPSDERSWLDPHRVLFLIGTEAPDYDKILLGCGVPNQGYNDTGGGNHDLRFDAAERVTFDKPAVRAQQEYDKAVDAFHAGRPDYAAYYLGAAAHYIGDLSQYGHTIKGEIHHAEFEEWVGTLTPSFNGGSVFERYIRNDIRQPQSAYDAVIQSGHFTKYGNPPVIPPREMDRRFDAEAKNDPAFLDSIGHTLNMSVNETANMLHKFYLEVVRAN